MSDNHFITVSKQGVLMARRKGAAPVAVARAEEGLVVRPEPELEPGAVVRVGETHVQILVRGSQDALPPSKADRFGAFLGKSYAMRSVFAVLERAAELLRSNGRVVVVDFAPHELEFLRAEQAHRRLGLSEDQMNIWASGAGLQVSSCRILPPSKGAGDKALTVCVWTLEKAKLERNSDDI